MKITKIELVTKNLALSKPYTIAYKTISEVKNVFMFIRLENGMVGIGASNPDLEVVGESPKDVLKNCQSDFFRQFIGKDIRFFKEMIDAVAEQFPNKPGTLAIWDIALHDAFGKLLNMPVAAFYGQKLRALPTSVTIGIMDVPDTLKEAAEYEKLGFKVLKIKTGQDVNVDIERVVKVTERWKYLKIRVDANQGYTLDELQKFIKATAKLGLDAIEQPLAVGEESLLTKLDAQHRRTLVADESLKNSSCAIRFAADPKPFGVYNIKLMKCGGISPAFEIATIAKAAGIDLFWGCNDESIVSITAALHAAFACSNTKYLDLDGSFDLAEDIVTGGFVLEEGMLRIGKYPGLGVKSVDLPL